MGKLSKGVIGAYQKKIVGKKGEASITSSKQKALSKTVPLNRVVSTLYI
jgi:hypothetical protein